MKERGDVEVVAPSYPGRDKLRDRQPLESAKALAAELVRVLFPKLVDGVPFAFWAHSVGTFVSFELLMLMRSIGLQMPVMAFFNAFPAPHMPEAERPWRVNRQLDDTAMTVEALRWDEAHFQGPAKVIREEPDWSKIWLPLFRADFRLFDEYAYTHGKVEPFSFPIITYHFANEKLCKPEMLRLWGEWTTGTFTMETFQGMGHLTCLYNPAQKKAYFEKAVSELNKVIG